MIRAALVVAALLHVATALPYGARAATGEPSKNVTFSTTWFGAKDNCPPGGIIAHPRKQGGVAGGVGTYEDPITFAGVKEREAPGTIYYVPQFAKYFIMEDDCQECVRGWREKKAYHIDLWMGPDTATSGPGIIQCENQLTKTNEVTVNPSHDEFVDTTPIFDAGRTANDGCIEPTGKCTNQGDKCGNLCQTPKKASCKELANLFALTLERFVELNKGLDCDSEVPENKTVCMGGTCGD